MEPTKNRFGLPRRIPADVRRAVRQRCKFCCVRCDLGIYQYHHFNPPFADAHRHDPYGITLLCGSCHDNVTRGFWSNVEIAEDDKRRRATSPTGNIFLSLKEPLAIALGSYLLLGNEHLIVIEGESVLGLRPDAERGLLLSGRFFDEHEKEALSIADNVLRTRADSWDVESNGPSITIRAAPADVVLSMRAYPPHGVHIERLRMARRGWQVDFDAAKGKIQLGRKGERPSLDLSNTVAASGGTISMSGAELKITGGSAFDPGYDGARFLTLMRDGRLDQVWWELLKQPVHHVAAAGPVWSVRTGMGKTLSIHETKGLALAAARALFIAEPRSRLVVHNEDGTSTVSFGEHVSRAPAR